MAQRPLFAPPPPRTHKVAQPALTLAPAPAPPSSGSDPDLKRQVLAQLRRAHLARPSETVATLQSVLVGTWSSLHITATLHELVADGAAVHLGDGEFTARETAMAFRRDLPAVAAAALALGAPDRERLVAALLASLSEGAAR